jgi:hypothetical protein
MDNRDKLIDERAVRMWMGAGRPAGGPDQFREQAADLVALEDTPDFGQIPVPKLGPYGEPIEPAEPVANLGEFPTLTDESEQHYPPLPDVEAEPDDRLIYPEPPRTIRR